MNPATSALVSRIRTIRGHKVLLASDLAVLYGVQTKALVQAVKRNLERFPPDFVFQLTEQELRALRSQIGEGLSFSVEGMAVAGDLWSHPNEGGSPEQYGSRVRTGAATAEHFSKESSHGFDGVCGPRNSENRVLEVRAVELEPLQELADRRLNAKRPAVGLG